MTHGKKFFWFVSAVVCFVFSQGIGRAEALTISSIQPDHGSTTGGTGVLIKGSGFTANTSFTIGGVSCTNAIGNSSTRRRCTTGAHSLKLVDVVGTDGSTQATLPSAYRYITAPTVSEVSPSYGYTKGNTRIAIYGSDFKSGSTVQIDTTDCGSVTFVSPRELQCTTQSHSIGLANVTVTNPHQVSTTLNGGFTFVQNYWGSISNEGAPTAREFHSAIWTGQAMIVWGGQTVDGPTQSGGVYDPITNTWSPTSLVNAPSARYLHHAIWTGSKMIIWAGESNINNGAMYDPETDTWTTISSIGAPPLRPNSSAVWTGKKMILWGGDDAVNPVSHSDGFAFDPETNTWTQISSVGAPAPRSSHSAEMVNGLMVIWGGHYKYGSPYYTDGGKYNPTTDAWLPISNEGTLSERLEQSSVGTDSSMIVWGGSYIAAQNDGAMYFPATDMWAPTTQVDAPEPRRNHSAVWTGSDMIVWGGTNTTYNEIANGGVYTPSSDSWNKVKFIGAPEKRQNHTAIWTGSSMIIWGGSAKQPYNDGGIYIP